MTKKPLLKKVHVLELSRRCKNAAFVFLWPDTLQWIREAPVRMAYYLLKKPVSGKKNSSRRDKTKSSDYIAYCFRGYPDEEQAHVLNQTIGCCRFLWNRMKADRDAIYNEIGVTVKNTPADYKDVEGCEFLKDVDSYALCNVQLNHERAYSEWLSGNSGKPEFKKKHACRDSYTTNKDSRSDNIKFEDGRLTLPKVPGTIELKAHRQVKPGGVLKSVTVIHEKDGRWTFSLLYEFPAEEWSCNNRVMDFLSSGNPDTVRHIGLDMSLPHLYVDSDGCLPCYTNGSEVIEFEKAFHSLEKKIAKEQRRLSRMVKGSNNYNDQLRKIASLHAKAKRQRKDFLEQVSARLAKEFDIISIEDLDIAGMKKALKFGKSVSDNGWGIFVLMLARKCEREGGLLVKISKWFPSSKTCSECGNVYKELQLSDRVYICPVCGSILDRDENAAVNIDEEGLRLVLSGYAEEHTYTVEQHYRLTA